MCCKFCSTHFYVLILSSACFTPKSPHLQSSQETSFELSISLTWKQPEREMSGGRFTFPPPRYTWLMTAWYKGVEAQLSCLKLGQTLQYNLDFRAPLGIRLRIGRNPKSHTCLGFFLSAVLLPIYSFPDFSSVHLITKPFALQSSSQGLLPQVT